MSEHPSSTGVTDEPSTGPRVGAAEIQDVSRLRRSTTDRHIAGVAGGLGRHLDIDPTVIRVVLVVLIFFGGAGLLIYAVGWLLVPEDGADHAPIELSADALKVALIGTVFVAALITFGTPLFAHGWGLGFPVPLLVAGLIAFGVYSVVRRGHRAVPPAGVTAPAAAPSYVPPPRPRRTGPVLFWPTLALIAIAFGVLGMVDVGHDVPLSAYPALALTVIGAMLLVGAFVGRPGGLIALGLVAALGMGPTAALDATTGGAVSTESVALAPTTAAGVEADYHYGTGSVSLDLSGVQDLGALDGRTVDLHLDAGEIDVVVPRGLNVVVDASIRYAGQIDIGEVSNNGGWNQSMTRTLTTSSAPGAPTLDLRLDSRVGEISVTTSN